MTHVGLLRKWGFSKHHYHSRIYEKTLPDRRLVTILWNDRVFVANTGLSASLFASVKELELAVTFQSLRPLP